MHSQALVIYPQNVELEDVMYPYQEVDKYPNDKINDERCQWILTVPLSEIPNLELEIEEYLQKWKNHHFESLQYRSEHSYESWKEKYGGYSGDCLSSYTYYCDALEEFNEIDNLEDEHPKRIAFLKRYGELAIDKPTHIYIEGKGFGFFHNPYQIWDYYTPVNEWRFSRDTCFLIAADGAGYNKLLLDVLDVPNTVKNIQGLTKVWRYIIFCEKDPKDSRIYTVDDIRFKYEWNRHCLVDNLTDVLRDIRKDFFNGGYMVTALDFHW